MISEHDAVLMQAEHLSKMYKQKLIQLEKSTPEEARELENELHDILKEINCITKGY